MEAQRDTERASTGTEAAERVADVLLCLSQAEDSVGITEVSKQLNLSKAVVHRILQSLASRDLVRINPETRKYHLGARATTLGTRALRQLDLRVVAREELMKLRDETEETTTLSLLVAEKRSYVDQYESPREIKMSVELGRLYPLHAGASSRAILAFLPKPEMTRILEGGLERLTSETIQDKGLLMRQLEEVQANGFAVSHGERQFGAGSVAAPIFGSDNHVTGAISVCGPIGRFDSSSFTRYPPLVTSAAARISESLGASRTTQ